MSGQRSNRLIFGTGLLKDIKKLSRQHRNKLTDLLPLLRSDAFDPRLHTKPLGPPLQGKYSFRVSRDIRVGFEFVAPHAIKMLAVDRRDAIYKRLRGR